MTGKTDANLVAAALRGDAESFSRLCEKYYPALVAIAYAQLGDRDLAEDAAQEALLAAYRDITRLNRADHFSPWLVAICRNIAIDMAKARAKAGQIGIEDCSPASKAGHHEDDRVGIVREILLGLEPGMRDVVFLRYYNQMSYGQIAAMLGVSEEAVNGKLRRARARIRQELQRRAAMEIEP